MRAADGGGRSGSLPAAIALLGASAAFWYVVFVVGAGNFWLKITVAAALLAAGSLAAMGQARRRHLVEVEARDFLLGAASAAVLYGVFVLGNLLLTAALPGAGEDIRSVYAPRGALPLWAVGVLLFGVTGPAEEIFWRGLLQHELTGRLGPVTALGITSLCYAAVHLWTLNLPLVLAAFTGGVFWGALYAWRRRLLPVIVSHSLWALAIFVLFPVV